MSKLTFFLQQGTPQSPDFVALIALLVGAGLVVGLLLGYAVFNSFRMHSVRQNALREMEKTRQVERERLRAIYDQISRMTSTLIYSRVLDMALDLNARALTASESSLNMLAGVALLFTNEGNSTFLRVGNSRRLSPADQRITLPAQAGALAQAINSGEVVLCKDIAADPELNRFIAFRSCRTAYCLPLRVGLESYGALVFAHPDTDFFNASRCDVLDIVAHQAIIAIQNARLYNDLDQEKERMVQTQEEARKKLARDLHDGPTQSVAAIAMRINFVRRLLEKQPEAAPGELIKIEELARRTTKEIRHMLFTLRPLILESEGLQAALQAMADKMRETYDQNVIVEVDQSLIPEIEIGRQTVIFYIAEEAVNNARKHAQAAHIWVRIRRLDAEMALLEIRDDGVGFDIGAVDASYDRRGSLGMVNMRERTDLISGKLRIDSAEGRGTSIQVIVPLTENAEDRLRQGG